MPLAFRAKGVSLSTATNWFFNFIVGESECGEHHLGQDLLLTIDLSFQ